MKQGRCRQCDGLLLGYHQWSTCSSCYSNNVDENQRKLLASSQITAVKQKEPGTCSNTIEILEQLVTALEGAFISSWQSTAAWQKELEHARQHLDQIRAGN